MRSLVVGRFQPLHMGHLRMLEYAASKSQYLVIGLGSCNKEDEPENPFSAQEREEMIKESFESDTPYEIKRIPDFGDDEKWVSWIIENISFDKVITNSVNERRIFEDADVKVVDVPFYDRDVFSATNVRQRIIDGKEWATLLPTGTIKVLEEVDGRHRVKKLSHEP